MNAVPSDRQLPFMAGETWWCSQDWYINSSPYTHLHEAAWDFNLDVSDLGAPLVAPSDGVIEYAGNTGGGYGTVVLISYPDGSFERLAHCNEVVVKKGEVVKKGQVVAFCGSSGSGAVHLHINAQSSSSPTASGSNSLECYFNYSKGGQSYYNKPEGCTCESGAGAQYHYTSLNHNIFDLAETGNHGSEEGSVHWWPGNWNASDRYDGNNCARRCYIQDYQGGSWNDCAIVYDALGGARKAYTVRTGFWENSQDNGWSEIGGPQSSLGMPITNEYSISSGARQEFQKGYMIFENNSVSVVTYSSVGKVAPGWTSSGWNNQYSYLFALAYERNGGATSVGLPSSAVYSYGDYGYLRQDFTGGSFGNCCIMYDPQNAIGNEFATNEAYLIRTGFYNYYQANGGSALGCPTRDEYSSRDPKHWDQATEYPLQTYFDRGAYEDDEASQHYMIWKNGSASYNSAYTTAFVSQSPSGQFNMAQGETRTLSVSFKNTGSNTWYNSSSHLDAYVELKSCDANGATCASFLNYPYSGSLGWLNEQTPCTMQESSVAPGGTATFIFTGKVANDASLGVHDVYFRPNHSVGGLMEGWDGMHFQVNVVAPPTIPSVTLVTGPGYMVMRDHIAFAFQIGNTVWFTTHYPVAGGDYAGTDSRVKMYRNGQQITAYKEGVYLYMTEGYTSGFAYEADYPRKSEPINYSYTYNGVPTFSTANSIIGGIWGDSHASISATKNGTSITTYKEAGSNYLVTPGTQLDMSAVYLATYPTACDQNIPSYVSLGPGQMVYKEKLTFAFQIGSIAWFTTAYPVYGADYSGTDQRVKLYCNGVEISGYKEGRWLYTSSGYNSSFAYEADYPRDRVTLTAGTLYNGWRNLLAPSYVWGATWGDSHSAVKVFKNGTQITAYKEVGNNIIVIPEADYSASAVYAAEYVEVYGTWSGKAASPESIETVLPVSIVLDQNYPNPFNPATTISYSVTRASHVSLTVYNILGQEVAKLVDSYQSAGSYTVPFDASGLPSGVYLYRLHTDQATETRKMLILK